MSKKKLALLLLLNTVLFLSVYYVLARFIPAYCLPLYIILGAGVLIAYLVYNRGFATKGATVEMLPDSMTREEKEKRLEEDKLRLEKSRWMLTILLPICLTLIVDCVIFDIIPALFGNG